MTWRAFIVGLVSVAAATALDSYTSFNKSWGWNTENHFPESAVFLLVFLTVLVNPLIKALRRSAALKQAELLLIWCMLIVGCTVSSDGLMSFWFPMMSAPTYVARRPDITWRDTALAAAPDTLLVTKNPKSVVVKQFFEGGRTGGRLPWGHWAVPITRWLIFIALFHLALLFLCVILRRQWVDRERLLFPLARASPVLFGAGEPWYPAVPFQTVLSGTALEHLYLQNVVIWWTALGFAYLVPADVSLSIWLFYLFGRAELLGAYWLGSSLHVGGTWSPLMRWQQAGAYIAFTIGTLYLARQHLIAVLRKAIGRRADIDDSQEPVGYRLSLWAFVLCLGGAVLWFAWYDMKVWVAALLVLLLLCIQLVHARIVSQSGIYKTWVMWEPADLLHSATFGRAFGATSATVAHMQRNAMLHKALLGPALMQVLRIGEVFGRSRRLLVPVLVAALMAALLASGWVCMTQAYTHGALSFQSRWRALDNPAEAFVAANLKIQRPGESQVRWLPVGIGVALTAVVMAMRARFCWWPVHSIGLVAMSNWSADRLWLAFLFGWLIKVTLVKFAGGRAVREARYFFAAMVLCEGFFAGLSTVIRTATAGRFPGF